jgi:zinc protease
VVATVFDTAALDSELKDAADRMQSLRVTDDDLNREKPRIAAELYNMYGGIPQLAANNLAREMIRPSAVGHRKGGVIDHISKFSAGEVQARWQKYYKPNNAMLVLAGRFDAVDANRKIQSLFSQIEPGDPPPKKLQLPKAMLTKLLRVKVKPIQRKARPRVCLAYAVPAPSDEIFPAFLVLVAKMQLQAVKLQSNPRQFPVQFRAIDDPSILYVTSEVRKGETAEDTIQRLDAFVLKIANESVGKDDLKLANYAFAFFYETSELPAATLAGNVYGVAFALGRRGQLAIDSKELTDAILNVRQDAIDRCRDHVFDAKQRATVVVTPE